MNNTANLLVGTIKLSMSTNLLSGLVSSFQQHSIMFIITWKAAPYRSCLSVIRPGSCDRYKLHGSTSRKLIHAGAKASAGLFSECSHQALALKSVSFSLHSEATLCRCKTRLSRLVLDYSLIVAIQVLALGS